MIDVLTTAIRRPEILDQTFASFREKLLKDTKCWLYLNIDPLGDAEPKDVVAVASKYFEYIHVNVSDTPNCTEAWKWCFENSRADVVFFLEDDWLLTREVDLNDALHYFAVMPNLGGLRFLKKPTGNDSVVLSVRKGKRVIMQYNRDLGIFEFIDNNKYSYGVVGNPCFYRGELVRALAKMLDVNNPDHPEKYIRNCSEAHKIMEPYCFGAYGKPNELPLIVDNGKSWRVDAGYYKKEGKGWRKCV